MSLSNKELERYSRHLLIEEFGAEAQLKLKSAKVLVVGAGGLGCPCLLYLTAAGIGVLGISDNDKVSLSNLQRQILYEDADLNLPKVDVAKRHLMSKNPSVIINTHQAINRSNALEIINAYDLVIDGTDNFSTRYLLNDTCVILNKPLIYGALFKFEGQVSVFNYKDGPTYRCLYPDDGNEAAIPGCSEVGVIGVLPGIIGAMQASEAIKVITGIGEPLSGKLFILNLLNNISDIFRFKTISANKEIKDLHHGDVYCETETGISPEILSDWIKSKDIQLIDVREEYEFERYNIGGVNMPLSDLEEYLQHLETGRSTVVLCQTGARSLKAIRSIKQIYPLIEIYNLKGGLENF